MKYSTITLQTNQIRLLKISASQSPDTVRCTLQAVALSEAPPFEALSYTWGDPSITRPIRVDDEEFRATANLEAFLRQRQTDGEQSPLWIDAICINQADVREKTAQVLKMADIYERCTWLTIWLGPGADESDFALQTLANAAKGILRWGSHDPEDRAIRNLLNRSWWTRVWIVQEIAFGAKGSVYDYDYWYDTLIDDEQTRLLGGRMSMGWGELVRAAVAIDEAKNSSDSLRTLLSLNVRSLEDGRQDISAEHHPGFSPLLITLSQHRGRQSTDTRDKVFALLRLAPRVRGDTLNADYSASFNDVLRRVVRREVSLEQTLNVLRYCQRRSRSVSTSWAPDWSRAEQETILPNMMAAIHVKPDVRFSNDLEILHAQGDFLGRARCVHKSRELVRRLSKPNPYGSEDDRINAFWQTLFGVFLLSEGLVGDCLGYDGPVSYLKWLPAIPTEWRLAYEATEEVDMDRGSQVWVSQGVDLPNNPFGIYVPDPFRHLRRHGAPAAASPDSSKVQALQAATLRRCRHILGRRLFVSKKGYVGLGPPDCVNGDEVVVLLGAEVPFILRSRDGRFQLIGESYVRGIMFGQVMDEVKKGIVEVSTVTLR